METSIDELEQQILAGTPKPAPKKAKSKSAKKEPKKAPKPDADLLQGVEELPLTGVTLQQLDAKIQQLRHEDDTYLEALAEANRLKKIRDNTKGWLASFLKENNRKSYSSTWGRVTVSKKFSVACPKTTEEKQALFDYLEKTAGHTGLLALQNIPSRELNKVYNEMLEDAQLAGANDFELPGVGAPTTYETISFTKK